VLLVVVLRGSARTTALLFLLGVALLALALFLDFVLQDRANFAEDSAKLLGALVGPPSRSLCFGSTPRFLERSPTQDAAPPPHDPSPRLVPPLRARRAGAGH
jgi:hypothetical protein